MAKELLKITRRHFPEFGKQQIKGLPMLRPIPVSFTQMAQELLNTFREAARRFQKAADQENADAQYFIGVMLLDGDVVSQDFAKAVRWLRNAADQRHVKAQYFLTESLQQMRNSPDMRVPQDSTPTHKRRADTHAYPHRIWT
jgi:TPR repeat protein